MRRKFIYCTAKPDGEVSQVFFIYFGKSVLQAKQAQDLYRRAEQLGHFFSLFDDGAALFLDAIVTHTSVRPELTTYQSLLKYFVI